MPRFPKGSQEAKDYMASIRKKRGMSGKGTSQSSEKKKPKKSQYGGLDTEADDFDLSVVPENFSTPSGFAIARPISVVATPADASSEDIPEAESYIEGEDKLLRSWGMFVASVMMSVNNNLDITDIANALYNRQLTPRMDEELRVLAVYLSEKLPDGVYSEVEMSFRAVKSTLSSIEEKRGLTDGEKVIKAFIRKIDDYISNIENNRLGEQKFKPMKMGKGLKVKLAKGSQEAKDYMASIRAKKGCGVSGSKEEGSEKKPLIARPSKLKDTDDVREQLNKNRYIIAGEVEKALEKGEITKKDREYLLTLLQMPYLSGNDDVNEIADNQSEVFMGLMERTAKKGSGMKQNSCKGCCYCMSGGSLVGGTPPPPPPPPPSRPPLPPPIFTSFNQDITTLNSLEEVLKSTTLPKAKREEIMALIKQLKDKIHLSRTTTAPSASRQKGAGVAPIFNKPSKIAPLPSAMIEGVAEPVNEVIGRIGAPYAEPIAMAIGEIPDATSAVISPKREKKIRAEIKKKIKQMNGFRNEINRNQMIMGDALRPEWVNYTEGQIQALQEEIDVLNGELTGIESVMANVEGSGIIKPLPKGFKGSGVVYY